MMSGVAVAMLLGMAAQAPDEQWRVAALGGDAPNRTVFFVDAARVERSGDRVRFWTQTIMESPPEPGAFDRSVILREGDCSAMSSAMLDSFFYANGRLIEEDRERGEATVHPADSMMAGVMEAVCGSSDYSSEPIDDPEGTTRQAFRQLPKG